MFTSAPSNRSVDGLSSTEIGADTVFRSGQGPLRRVRKVSGSELAR